MLNTVRKVCGIDKEKFYVNLDHIGNTVSSTVMIGLKDCMDHHFTALPSTIMIAGFGVGLSWGATILKLQNNDKE